MRVIVGLSGGVDSSVAAFLLKQQGYDVHALFMKNWEEDDTENYCSASEDISDAQIVCDQLKIPLQTVNFAAEYWDHVFEYFLEEHRQGRTPNPDILCNKEIKFKAFLNYAKELGADFIATGHYARKLTKDGQHYLLTGQDSNKDQSYFLYTLGQPQLAPTLFPIGNLAKTEVRQIAQQAALITHNKKDSTGICFIGERKFKEFLAKYLPAQPGHIETVNGKILGKHDGLMYYTLGQRRGIGIGGLRESTEQAWYVLSKDLTRNVLIVAQDLQNPLFFSNALRCSQMSWISGTAPPANQKYGAKIRYRQVAVECTITEIDLDQYLIKFSTPQRSVTPGQSVVFYQDEICLGGGVIDSYE